MTKYITWAKECRLAATRAKSSVSSPGAPPFDPWLRKDVSLRVTGQSGEPKHVRGRKRIGLGALDDC
ncbi:uncharacterized protein ACLA_053240 [Aspergillus clavatus NRRL 1]|uniref:Uncharacterized protein n=1 Tax=Aspergillus clavatus (strain ATCC 1007 / CBS 513.65 / DSM 816 / NCTC 3887 / NRRL 1 / QM 1276 / 107) TaxID=344612 RepID=A1CIZ5_ASPCL|nr:uncharacterized protein ACLA_053240 [Aspergillus clavatus NRRL 1]EAW10850.1 hypothetical protein ACLA_053240 [Aspergillus clavatus NRRL 1]